MNLPKNPMPRLNQFLVLASSHETKDPIVAYWARFYAVQLGLTIDKSSPEAKSFLFALLGWLEQRKKELNDDSINNESVAEAHIENYAIKIFLWADGQERNSVHNKNVVKAFFTAGLLFDILSNFTKDLSEDIGRMKKYAKWRAAYINNCLKNGQVPQVPLDTSYDYDEGAQDILGPDPDAPGSSSGQSGWNFPSAQPPSQPPSASNTGPIQQPVIKPQPPVQQPVAMDTQSNYDDFLSVEKITKAQKYCKWGSAALNFDDVPTAVINLKKALHLLETGEELDFS